MYVIFCGGLFNLSLNSARFFGYPYWPFDDVMSDRTIYKWCEHTIAFQTIISNMTINLEKLLNVKTITKETYDWLKPLHEKEIADLEEIQRAALERKNNPFYQHDDDDSEDEEDGLLTTSTSTIRGIEGTDFSIQFVTDTNSTGHGNKVWHASIATCRYLKDRFTVPKREDPTQPFRCLELGAGTALPSLFLAKLLSSGLKQSSQTSVLRVTDAKYYRNIMQILRSVDIHDSTGVSENGSIQIEVHPHNWGTPIEFGRLQENEDSVVSGFSPHDLVIVSDCIYNPEYHDDLLVSLSRTLALPSSTSSDPTTNGGVAVVSFSLHGNVRNEVIWEFLESKLPSQRMSDGKRNWHLRAQCVSTNVEVESESSTRQGWDMETTMNDLGMETEGINPERWIAYVYEITWVPTE